MTLEAFCGRGLDKCVVLIFVHACVFLAPFLGKSLIMLFINPIILILCAVKLSSKAGESSGGDILG